MPNWLHLPKLEGNFNIAVFYSSYGLIVAKNNIGLLILISTQIDGHDSEKPENSSSYRGSF